MDDLLRKQIQILYEQGAQGLLGERVKNSTRHYASLPEGPDQWIQLVNDIYTTTAASDVESPVVVGRTFCEILIALYRESKKRDQALSAAFLNSLICDHPEVPNTVIFPSWESLVRAQAAFSTRNTTDPLLLFEQLKKLTLDYNNFFDRLSGYLLLCYRCVYGKPYKVNSLGNRYRDKLRDLDQVSGGENGIFCHFFRCAEPRIRNAIAHGNIWLDPDSALIRYNDTGARGEIPIMLLMAKVMIAVEMAKGYIAAITTILVLETGDDASIKRLPQHLVQLFKHASSLQ